MKKWQDAMKSDRGFWNWYKEFMKYIGKGFAVLMWLMFCNPVSMMVIPFLTLFVLIVTYANQYPIILTATTLIFIFLGIPFWIWHSDKYFDW